jgi:hypothetical protein
MHLQGTYSAKGALAAGSFDSILAWAGKHENEGLKLPRLLQQAKVRHCRPGASLSELIAAALLILLLVAGTASMCALHAQLIPSGRCDCALQVTACLDVFFASTFACVRVTSCWHWFTRPHGSVLLALYGICLVPCYWPLGIHLDTCWSLQLGLVVEISTRPMSLQF